jgi:hypothetical protein
MNPSEPSLIPLSKGLNPEFLKKKKYQTAYGAGIKLRFIKEEVSPDI